MKSEKTGVFANSATGYGKKSNNNSKSAQKHSANCPKSTESKEKKDTKPAATEELEGELNSGFGTYLRSNEGVEMMKLFVFANTIMVVLTMAWPHFKMLYIWFMQWLDTFYEE